MKMMRTVNCNCNKNLAALLISVSLTLAAFPAIAEADENGYALMIQQSPPDAGMVTPAGGVHSIQVGSTVTISAIPKPGYRFVYWMGDVVNPTALSTEVRVNAPKIVVAKYVRDDFEDQVVTAGGGFEASSTSAPGQGQGGLYSSLYPIENPDSLFSTANTRRQNPINFSADSSEEEDIFSVPGSGNGDVTVDPIPEPTTLGLFALGGLILSRRKRS